MAELNWWPECESRGVCGDFCPAGQQKKVVFLPSYKVSNKGYLPTAIFACASLFLNLDMCIITRMKLLQIPVPFLLGSHDVSTDKANESTKQGYSICNN